MTSHRPWLVSFAVAAGLATATAMLATATAGAEPGGPDAVERYALLVGVQEYQGDLSTIREAEVDAVELFDVLKGSLKIPADHMVLLTRKGDPSLRRTPTKEHILEQLDLLLAGLRGPDTLIVVLAGQGVQFRDDADPYFCPIDARLDDRSTLIPLGEIRRRMEGAPGGLKLLVVDAGRNDPSDPAPEGRGVLPAPTVRVEETRRRGVRPPVPGTVTTFFSCSRGQGTFAYARSRRGAFFRYLIDGLRGQADLDEDGLGTLGEIRTYVSRNVRNHVRDQHAALQQPELVGGADPDAVLVAFRAASLLLKRGEELFADRKFEDVIRVCSRLLEHDPRLSEAYLLRGKARIMDGGPASAAIDDFTAALKHAPGFARAHLERGLLYLETGAPERAIADFDAADRLGLTSRDVSFYRGIAHLQGDRFQAAVADFNEAIRIGPELPAAFLNRGVARYRLDLPREALADFEKAIALDPKMARAYLNRGVLRMTMGDLDGAISDFDATIQQSRRAGDVSCVTPAYFDRGKAFFLKKDYARAIEDWERLLRNFEDRDSMTLDHLGLAYARLQNEARAARYFEDAIRLDDTHTYAPAHAHLGAVRYNQNDYEAAIRECTEAIKIDPTFAEAYATRGLAFRALKQPDRARADEEQSRRLRSPRQNVQLSPETRRK